MVHEESFLIIDSSSIHSVSELNAVLVSATDRKICLARKEVLSLISNERIVRELSQSDIIHCGLNFEGAEAFTDLQALTLNWNFLVPSGGRDSYTWRGTSDFICFDSGLVKKMNGFVPGLSLQAAIMEFCYRAMTAGAKVKYIAIDTNESLPIRRSVSKSDNLYVAKHHLGNKHYYFLRLYYLFFRFSLPKINVSVPPPIIDNDYSYQFRVAGEKVRSVGQYSAIIPTINRYDYLTNAIQSLLEVDFPPAEIIIVDQSPVQNRIAGYYDQFLKRDDVKVVFLDTAGQTISRNTAIDLASHEWIYLFDDDSICWKECITEHRYVIEHSTADCSTGLSLAPWKDVSYIDQQNLFYRISDVLDTGNCFIHKSALLAVGKLDMAYNKGPGADDDLGKRLYLSGHCIVLNPKAIRTHFKAKSGGLRQYGAWWRHKTTLFGPSPPPTLLYAIKKYYPKKFWFFLISIWLLKAKEKHNFFEYSLLLLLFPFKLFASFRQTSTLGLKK